MNAAVSVGTDSRPVLSPPWTGTLNKDKEYHNLVHRSERLVQQPDLGGRISSGRV